MPHPIEKLEMKIPWMPKTGIPEDSMLYIAQIPIFTFAVELLLAAVVFLLGFGLNWCFFPVSFAMAAIICGIIHPGKITWFEIVSSLAIILFCAWLSGLVYDVTWDGNSYHKLAVGLLKNHWNPLQSPPRLSFVEGPGVDGFGNTKWVEGYCKASWIFAAGIYGISGNIETGKCYTMIAMCCAFLLVFHFMRKKNASRLQSATMASVTALNPIAVQQMTSYYLDGFLHTMLMLLVVSLLMREDRERFGNVSSACMVAATMIVCGNVKFTGLLYGGVFCIAYYLHDCCRIIGKKGKWMGFAWKEGIFYACLALATVAWAGNTSYVTNAIRHGSPAWPLTGEGKVDIMTGQSAFREANHCRNLFLSLFSRVDNFQARTGKTPVLKVPFTWDRREIECTRKTDVRISGFGILFGGLFLVALLMLLPVPFSRRDRGSKSLILLNLAICLGLTFGIKESWWARYSPHVYMLVLVPLYAWSTCGKKAGTLFASLFAALVLANNCVPLIWLDDQINESKAIAAGFAELEKEGPLEICNKDFQGIYCNFRDCNIQYRVNNRLAKAKDLNKTGYGGTLWRKQQAECPR